MTIHLRNFIILLLLFISFKGESQTIEAGVNFGYHFSRLVLPENDIAENLYISQGKPSNGGSFGLQLMMRPPAKQSSAGFKIVPALLIESSLCRCEGNVSLRTTSTNGALSLTPLNYVFYRGDHSAKFVGQIKDFQFLIGPTVTNHFYVGVKNGSDKFGYSNAAKQFKQPVFGYEFGAAIKINRAQFSLRYHKIAGDFGKETAAIPTAYKNYQVRIMLHYYFLKKEKGLNWNSIYWD